MTHVVMIGPMFDGRADAEAQAACDEAERSVAILGASIVRTELNVVLKKQTPIYRMRVEARPMAPWWKITDQGIIYGHWLEGTGSRNYPRTRFRGYATFRRMRQVIQHRADVVARNVVARYVGRMQ